MNKEFVPYDLALALKELGFDYDCFGLYNSDFKDNVIENKILGVQNYFNTNIIVAPLYQQAFRWFREKGFNFCIDSQTLDGKGKHKDYFFNIDKEREYIVRIDSRDGYTTYEEAELACLRKLIEIVKEK